MSCVTVMEFKCSKCPGLLLRSQGEKKKHKNFHKDIGDEHEAVKGANGCHGKVAGGQKASGSGQGGGQEAVGGGQEAAGAGQEAVGGGQEAGGGGQEARGGGQEAEGVGQGTGGGGGLVYQVFVLEGMED